MADRKKKGKAVSSSSEVPKFKTPYHEAYYKSKLSARRVLPELIIQVDEDILDPCGLQIQQRKWERFTSPIQAVGHLMVKEFMPTLGNRTKKRGSHIPTQQCNIKRVLKLRKDPLPNAASYHERKANKDYRLEHVLEDLCIEGVDWVRHKDGRPHYLRRADLEPMKKGWYDFVCRSILSTTNRSELTVERAVLIHSIIIGENINMEEIIADLIYKFVYKIDLSSSLPFPSIIAALCADAKIYRRLDNQQEESRKSFEAINQRMDRMDDQLSFLCYSNQMVNETMYFPYQNTARQFREMEAQGIPVTIANLAIHRHREEEMNQERMRHDQMVQEATSERTREANKGKAREVVPDSEEEDSEELASSASKEW
ncbi:hypothetical protein PIB30_053001 [Stylosanthes scabra]|uniref:Putative plant transposon protein domain-containing protein n=1 Tax=Stylosanthes scabra TaxID=79078 RepID=A0ABU6XG40_9FABA|nr:hypothetical protein [Stylosanthes scabra]